MIIESEMAIGLEPIQFSRVKIPKKLVPRIEREQVWNHAPLLRPAADFIRHQLAEGSVLRDAFDNPSEYAFRGFRRIRGEKLRKSLNAVEANGAERDTKFQDPWFIPADPTIAMYYAYPNWGEVGVIIVSRASGMRFKGNPITYTADLQKGQTFRELCVGTIQFELVNFLIPLT